MAFHTEPVRKSAISVLFLLSPVYTTPSLYLKANPAHSLRELPLSANYAQSAQIEEKLQPEINYVY